MKKIINEILNNQKSCKKNLVSQITNVVSVSDNANIALFLNTSPIVITYGEDEYKEIIKISKALLINIGTLEHSKNFLKAIKIANKYSVPVILDPVGVGASSLRNNCINEIISTCKVSLIRGNYSEILYLAGIESNICGVDSNNDNMNIEIAIKKVSQLYNCVVVASGGIDYIGYKDKIYIINLNIKPLGQFTGSGCNLSAACASFLANCNQTKYNFFHAAITATLFYKYCAYLSKNKSKIMQLKIDLFNNIYSLSSIKDEFINNYLK